MPASSVEAHITIEVHRAQGLTARRAELDGYAGAMNRLRAAYDAMQQTWPAAHPPDPLVDAMQSGDRLGYHPEKVAEEMAHFRDTLPTAQGAVDTVAKDLAQRMNDIARNMNATNKPSDMEAQKQHRLDALTKAQKLIAEASDQSGKEPAKVTPAQAAK